MKEILPVAFLERMKNLLGSDFQPFLDSFDEPSVRGLLINTAKITEERFDEIFPFKTSKITYANHARRLLDEVKVGGNPLYHAGLFYMQDPGAMVTAASVSSFGEIVLDMCAAPGGKTIAAALASPASFIIANEPDGNRRKILTENIDRLGLKNVSVTAMKGEDIDLPERFDTIICDAPCSGEGMFRKEAIAIEEWNEGLPQMNAERQRGILKNAVRCLKPGGTLIYSTCTYSVEEDEENVNFLIENCGMIPIMPTDITIAATVKGIDMPSCNGEYMRRFYPHHSQGEGQFFAVLRKEGTPSFHSERNFVKPITMNERSKLSAALSPFVKIDLSEVICEGGMLVLPPNHSGSFKLNYAKDGVCIGKMENGRLVPHHNLFTAFGDCFTNYEDLDLDDPRLKAYLRGEEIDAVNSKNGWCCIKVLGFALGGGKTVDGKIKNHYPKKLRVVEFATR